MLTKVYLSMTLNFEDLYGIPFSFERYTLVSIEELKNLFKLELCCAETWTGPFKMKGGVNSQTWTGPFKMKGGCQADMQQVQHDQECDYSE